MSRIADKLRELGGGGERDVDEVLEDVIAARRAGNSPEELFGGPRDWIDTILPTIAFTLTFMITHEMRTALWAAGISEALVVLVRVVRRETLRHAFSGVFGIAIAAFFAAKSGNENNFFLPGILINAVYAVGFLLSIVFKHPVVGLIMRLIWPDRPKEWHSHPVVHRAYAEATAGWAGVSILRVVVQEGLRRAGQTGWLGASKIAMGYPLYLAALALTKPYIDRRTRSVPVPPPAAEPAELEEPAEPAEPDEADAAIE